MIEEIVQRIMANGSRSCRGLKAYAKTNLRGNPAPPTHNSSRSLKDGGLSPALRWSEISMHKRNPECFRETRR